MRVNNSVIAAGRMEKAYGSTQLAISNVPIAVETDNVIGQVLMQNMLRNEMHVLLAGILRTQRSLVESVKILIRSGGSDAKNFSNNGVNGEQKNARKNLVECLEGLRWLEILKAISW